MKLKSAVICALVGSSTLWVAAQEGPRLDGRWEVTVEMEMPGMPMKMPAQTMTRCVTKEEAADPQKALPQGDPKASCKISDYKVAGNKLTWAMKCDAPQPMSGAGEMVYEADAYKGTVTMDMAGHTMAMKHSGKRLGDCTK